MRVERAVDLGWPLVGRRRHLELADRLLRDGRRGVMLAGPAGVGKTRLAGECLSLAANAGFAPLRIGATRSAAGLPFGAYASLLPDLPAESTRGEVLRRAASGVMERGEGRPVAILVDDAHLLDDSSAALTHLLAAGDQPLFLVTTLRSGEPAPDAVLALWKNGLTERLELDPLTPGEMADLVALALGGPVDSATTQLLWDHTEGNVLFLKELVIAAVRRGTLGDDAGTWRLSGPLAISSRLLAIIETRLGELSDPVRRALAIVALGEPLGADMLARIEGGTDLEDLERRGLLAVARLGRRLDVRLAHPLYGEAVLLRLSPLRARALTRVLADALEATGVRRREDTLRVATLRLDGAGSLSPELMLRAATTARQRFDLPLAERLARAAFQAGAGFDAGMLLGQLRWWQGHAQEADRQLSTLTEMAATDAQRAALATVRMDVLAFGLNRNSEALRIADETEKMITATVARDQVTAYRARALGWSGQSAAAAAAMPLLTRSTGRTLIAACMAAATNLSLCGRISDAIAATHKGHAEHLGLTGPPLTFSPGFHLYLRCLALNCAGRLAEAEALGQSEYDEAVRAGSLEGRACFSMFLAATHLGQGRLSTAVRVASDAVSDCKQIGWPLTIRIPLIWLVRALALRGDSGRARVALSEIDSLQVPAGHLFGPEVLRARAWVEVAGGVPSDGYGHLQEAVSMANAGGAHALEAGALHDLARLGYATEVRSRMRQLTAVVEGPIWTASARHVDALVEQDAQALVGVSIEFARLGATLLAAEAAADSAVAWRRMLEPRKATAAELRARALAAQCEGARTPALTAAAAARATLTPRELEIARLAAKGWANRDIASRLYISHRTVENNLHVCYGKLGANGRGDLPRALAEYS